MKSFISAFWKAGVVIILLIMMVTIVVANAGWNRDNLIDIKDRAKWIYITVKNLDGSPQGEANVRVWLPNGQPHTGNPQITNDNGFVKFEAIGGPGTYSIHADYTQGRRSGSASSYVPPNSNVDAEIILNIFY
jgi:hypothetical protein